MSVFALPESVPRGTLPTEPKDRTNARRQKEFRVRKKGSLDSPKTESETENRGRADETVTPLPLRIRYASVTHPLRNDPVTGA